VHVRDWIQSSLGDLTERPGSTSVGHDDLLPLADAQHLSQVVIVVGAEFG
jgi:hypothetical protein